MESVVEGQTSARVLVVEDSDLLRSQLLRTLQGAGYQVGEASDGETGLELVGKEPWDLIVLDKVLPRIQGTEVLRRIKADPKTASIPVLFVTGVQEIRAQVEALDAGADDYMVKPYDDRALLARIRVHLRIRRQEAELVRKKDLVEERNIELTLKNAELSRLAQFKASALTHLAEGGATPTAAEGDFYDKAEQAMHGRKVLVIVEEAFARKLAARAVLATGASVETLADGNDVETLLDNEGFDVLLTDWQNASLAPKLQHKYNDLQTVLLSDEPEFEGKRNALMDLPASSLMVANALGKSRSRDPMAVRQLVTAVGKLVTKDIFGLEKYLGWGAAIRDVVITSSGQRRDLIDEVQDFAKTIGVRPRMVRNIVLLVDELLMNAVWDAPADDKGKAKYHDLPRSTPVELSPDERPVLRYGCDGSFFALSVSDPFGRLEHDLAFRYLQQSSDKDTQKIKEGSGGAGLGLYMAYNAASSFVVNVEPGRHTEVIGLINLLDTSPSAEPHRSFCYFRSRLN